jgi:hypothetical protein
MATKKKRRGRPKGSCKRTFEDFENENEDQPQPQDYDEEGFLDGLDERDDFAAEQVAKELGIDPRDEY